MYVHIYMYIHICIYVCMCMYIYTNTYTCTHTHIYVHIHIAEQLEIDAHLAQQRLKAERTQHAQTIASAHVRDRTRDHWAGGAIAVASGAIGATLQQNSLFFQLFFKKLIHG